MVFNMSKAINHLLWLSLAAFHRATPFHGSIHAIAMRITHGLIDAKIDVSICRYPTPGPRANARGDILLYNHYMKYAGIDFGAKRIGIALSDEAGNFAFPLTVLENSAKTIDDIAELCETNHVGTIIIGESQDFHFVDNPIMKEARQFAETLGAKTHMPVLFHPEFLTSAEAERLQGKNDMLDASAAALILKSYLDIHTPHGTETTD